MNNSHRSTRRRPRFQLAPEALESRQLLTGGAGSTFAIIPGTITTADTPAVVKFTLDTGHWTLPHGKLTLGVDIAGDTTNSPNLNPTILGLEQANGKGVAGTSRTLYDKSLLKAGTVTNPVTTAVLTPVSFSGKGHNATATYSVVVAGAKGQTGKFLLGFFLPGDANGDGVVNQTDLSLIKSEMNSHAGTTSTKYTFDADTNRDGRINAKDLAIVRQNMGASTTISASISANLDPASTTGVDRVTTNSTVHFSGTATPGATVTYTNGSTGVKPVSTTTDASGNYSLMAPLVSGSNTFQVTTQDAFGQSVSGAIAPVTMQTNPPVTSVAAAAAAAKTSTS